MYAHYNIETGWASVSPAQRGPNVMLSILTRRRRSRTSAAPIARQPALVFAALLLTTSLGAEHAGAQVYVDGEEKGTRITGYSNRALYTRTPAQRAQQPARDPFAAPASRGSNTMANPLAVANTNPLDALPTTFHAANAVVSTSTAVNGRSARFRVDPWYRQRYRARHPYYYAPQYNYRPRYTYVGYPYGYGYGYRYPHDSYYGSSGFRWALSIGSGIHHPRGHGYYRNRGRQNLYFDGYRYRYQDFRTNHKYYGGFGNGGYCGDGGLRVHIRF